MARKYTLNAKKKKLKIQIFLKPEGKRPHGRTKSRWRDNIIWILKKQGSMLRTGFISFRVGTGGRALRKP
jgi:hypothetical protein